MVEYSLCPLAIYAKYPSSSKISLTSSHHIASPPNPHSVFQSYDVWSRVWNTSVCHIDKSDYYCY